MNRRAPFRQVDVTRALRAAKAAGLKVSRFEISADGKIIVDSIIAPVATDTVAPPGRKALEKWKAEQDVTAKQGRV
jgi:hypothetical protein